jgi:TonB-linked SusC/RagA family outer membrane protein
MVKKVVLLATFLFGMVSIFAQERSITGKVVDETGSPMPGATVKIKGTDKASVTDVNGTYSITVSSGATLVFSYVGYTSQEIEVGEKTVIDVTMQPEVTSMDEVVVIGYGVQKKSLVTAAIAKVEAKDIASTVSTRFEQALQGKTSGMVVVQNSGAPGSGMTIKIRGNSSDGSNAPLYIVDGVKTGGLEYLNPGDIESVEILKDAASAAIYGAEGGNGVVLITTKKGQKGNSIIEYKYSHGEQTATNLPKVMNGEQYRKYFMEATTIENDATHHASFAALDSTVSTDWVNEIFQTAPMDQHDLIFSGGSEKTSYYLSSSYLTQDGIVGGSKNNFTRYSFRSNAESELKSWFTAGINMSYTRFSRKDLNATNEYGGIINNAMNYEPTLPIYYADSSQIPSNYKANAEYMAAWNRDAKGRYYTKSNLTGGEAWNPLAQIDYTDNNTTQDKILGDIHASLKPFKGFVFTSRIYTDFAYQKHDNFADKNVYGVDPLIADSNTFVEQSWDRWFKYGIENFATYDFSIGQHLIQVMAGQSYEDYDHFWLYDKVYNIPYTSKDFAFPGDALDKKRFTINDQTSYPEHTRQASYFGRLSWNYKEKYMVQANIRQDGASNFGPDNPWGYFPSVSAGWIVSKENFFIDNVPQVISNLKIRGSWGQNGSRQALGAFPYVTTMTTVYYSDASQPGSLELGKVPGTPANTALKWETSDQLDFGLDLGLLKNSLTFTVDWYRKQTIDQLAPLSTLPSYMGFQGTPMVNSGKIDNRGWEFELAYRNNIGDFNYSINFNASYLKNEVLDYGAKQGKDGVNVGQMGVINRYDIGQPVWYFYGYKAIGIFQSQQEIDNYGYQDTTSGKFIKYQPKAKPGDVKFENLYVDSLGHPDNVIDGNDRTYIGKPMPDWTFGLTFNFEFKGFDLNIFFQGVTGNQIYWANYRKDRVTYNKADIYFTDRWTGEGTSNRYPRATYTDANENFRVSSLNIYDGDYLRLKSLTFGYTLPSSLTKKIMISKLRIYYSGTNLITWTNYPGTDPEIGMYDTNTNASYGIDKGVYPPTRIHTFGVDVIF